MILQTHETNKWCSGWQKRRQIDSLYTPHCFCQVSRNEDAIGKIVWLFWPQDSQKLWPFAKNPPIWKKNRSLEVRFFSRRLEITDRLQHFNNILNGLAGPKEFDFQTKLLVCNIIILTSGMRLSPGREKWPEDGLQFAAEAEEENTDRSKPTNLKHMRSYLGEIK